VSAMPATAASSSRVLARRSSLPLPGSLVMLPQPSPAQPVPRSAAVPPAIALGIVPPRAAAPAPDRRASGSATAFASGAAPPVRRAATEGGATSSVPTHNVTSARSAARAKPTVHGRTATNDYRHRSGTATPASAAAEHKPLSAGIGGAIASSHRATAPSAGHQELHPRSRQRVADSSRIPLPHHLVSMPNTLPTEPSGPSYDELQVLINAHGMDILLAVTSMKKDELVRKLESILCVLH
jgi:hypothetical protein